MSERSSDAEWGRALWDWIREQLPYAGMSMEFDTENLMRLAESHGRARKVRYNPDVHGDVDVDPGDDIWWWADEPEGKS